MCGFVGEIRLNHRQHTDPSLIDSMLESMASRGPDGEGMMIRNHIGLGHRRLKIIDLSPNADQPLIDSHLRLAIVFNGAIYNYPELREELIGLGYSFFSTGDTEVILKAYHAWGKDCLQRFNGMFAFAVWNLDSDEVFMARDRLGIKPMYLYQDNHTLRFASTLPALMQDPSVDRTLDPVALNYYMSFHAVVPAPHTMYKHIRKLPPATWMVVRPDGKIESQTYWTLSFERSQEEANRSEEEWTDAIESELKAAVQRRMVADVPVGVLLSGGLDSSLVVGLLSELGHPNISTFSIGFENVAEEAGNEFKYSDIIAKRYQTDHHKIFATDQLVHDHLFDCIGAMSEPMVSHDVIGFYLLSREVSQHVKVVQSGQGADEVFAGYHWYPPMANASAKEAAQVYRQHFFDRDFESYGKTVSSQWVEKDYAGEFVENHFNQPGATDSLDKALRIDATIMLVDDPVKRVDNMTMAWGLEARVPFLDHQLVELAARVPGHMKLPDTGKYILKQVGRRIIPHEVIDRPKGYFPVPALKYLQGSYLDMVRSVLTDKQAQERQLFNPETLEQWLSNPTEYITPLRGSMVWQAALLEIWLQHQEKTRTSLFGSSSSAAHPTPVLT